MSVVAAAAMTPERIDFVLNNLWERGRRELEDLGVTRTAARQEVMEHAVKGTGWCIEANGSPAVLVGLVVKGGGRACTWFLATEEFDSHFLQLTSLIMERLPQECDRLGLREVEILSASRHPKAAVWFRAMGFRSDPTHHSAAASGARIRRYVRTFVTG